MKRMTFSKAILVSCAMAVAAGCSNGANRQTSSDNPSATAAPRAERSAASGDMSNRSAAAANDHADMPMTVIGCLQRGPRNSYILTRLNEPSQKSVGTSGTPAAVEREQ